jgi:uncharacterized protein
MLKLLFVVALAIESDGTTPLLRAVHGNDMNAVERLIKGGADVNAKNDYGTSPILEAALNGNTAIIERLLKAGADPNSAGPDGMTPLMIIARNTNVKAAQ